MKGKLIFEVIVVSVLLLAVASTVSAQDIKPQCIGCHRLQVDWIDMNEHAGVDCSACHVVTEQHLVNPTRITPETKFDPAVCGDCHKDQYDSLMTVDLKSLAKQEKATPTGRAPPFDKLLMPHGFTKEHAEHRSHVFMLIDHLLVDRAYKGRFQFSNWTYISEPGRAWDVLVDTGKTLPETAGAGNPVCFTCKTTDHLLEWAFLGDKNPRAKWDRTSDAADFALQQLQHPMGCIHCHDPHSTKPRIVRDALIQAVERDGTYPYLPDKGVGRVNVTVETFRDFRKIGILDKPDSVLMCAQCHVEYNCNPGHDPFTGEKIGMDDRRANFFPWRNVFDVQETYDTIRFRDFKHAITGASLIKAQHPEVEVLWGSKHDVAGVQCQDCHMPKMTNDAGIIYTSHWQTSPKNYLNETCIRCHATWSEEEAAYQIDAIQGYIMGKMRKAEFWLVRFIDTYEAAERAGVPENVLKEVRPLHDTAHINWEWWTAENSDGFHNPTQARESLTTSITASKEGIRILEEAIAEAKVGAIRESQAAMGLSVIAIVVAGAAIYLRKRK